MIRKILDGTFERLLPFEITLKIINGTFVVKNAFLMTNLSFVIRLTPFLLNL